MFPAFGRRHMVMASRGMERGECRVGASQEEGGMKRDSGGERLGREGRNFDQRSHDALQSGGGRTKAPSVCGKQSCLMWCFVAGGQQRGSDLFVTKMLPEFPFCL